MELQPTAVLPTLASILHLLGAVAVTIDAVLRKHHVPAVIGWIGLAWLAPIIGSLIYLSFGINRIRRKALALHPRQSRARSVSDTSALKTAGEQGPLSLQGDALAARHPGLPGLVRLGGRVTGIALTAGNRVEPLINGDQTFPAMLAAIEEARASISLASYIFDNDETGRLFLDALERAQRRGVAVRVLIDAVGARYSSPTMLRLLRRSRIPADAFLPTKLPRVFRYANLRNHRKILVADGRLGLVGGTNIRHAHWLEKAPSRPARCLHFRLEGPIAEDLQRTFAMDWAFTTGEMLDGDAWFPPPETHGTVLARGVPDGPDEDLDKILELMLGALSAATERVRVLTPYFILDDVLSRMLQITALRGVHVDIVLPARSNIPLMDWAMAPQLEWLLEKGCHIHLTPPPFDHSKALVIDGLWSLIGSSNWDPRSLRLNFEYDVECYDSALATRLERLIDEKRAHAHPLTLAELRSRGFATRLRNGLARLLSPYL